MVALVYAVAERARLDEWILVDQGPVAEAELVVPVVGFGEPRALLEDTDSQATLRQNVGGDAAARTGADDDRVERLSRHRDRSRWRRSRSCRRSRHKEDCR